MDHSERVVARYIYRSLPGPNRLGVTIMLVARLEGSNVVARVHPLGRGANRTPRSGLDVRGPWSATASRRYAKARVVATPALNGAINS